MGAHVSDSLGAYVLGALDEDEAREVSTHLATCPECRAQAADLTQVRVALGDVPPEALLDGPPDDDDLLLRRALVRVRRERRAGVRARNLAVSAAAVVVVALALGGGVLLGKANQAPAALPSTATAGAQHMVGSSGGVRLDATVMPASGWVRVKATVSGIPAGQRCQLVVVSTSGRSEVAGSWLVSPKAAAHGIHLEGAALVDPHQVARVEIRSFTGYMFVAARK
jgi:predicted anti-sigma-YlaC factor YlaD